MMMNSNDIKSTHAGMMFYEEDKAGEKRSSEIVDFVEGLQWYEIEAVYFMVYGKYKRISE